MGLKYSQYFHQRFITNMWCLDMSARYYALHLHLCIRFGSSNEQVLVAIIPNIYKLIICTFLNISAAICPLYLLFIN